MRQKQVLATVRRPLLASMLLRHLFAAAAAAGGLLLAMFLMDAIADLPERLRAVTPLLVAAVLAAVMVLLVVRMRALRERRIAQMLEQRNPTLGNRLTNAVELAEANQPTDIGEYLRLSAVELGAKTAASVQLWPFVRRGIGIAAGSVVIVTACWVALIAGAPAMYQAVLPRFVDPHGDHPPFSDLKIEVTPRTAEVLYGGQLEVRATTAGRPVEKLWVVTRAGTNTHRAVMFLAPDRSFFQTLVNLRQPAQFHVTDGRARSHWYPIRMRYTPQVTLVELETTFPTYTRREPRTTKLTEKIAPMPEGTRIRFKVASNRPLRDGALTVTPLLGGAAQEIPLPVQAQSNIVAGEFLLENSSAFSLAIRDVDGLAASDTPQGRLEVLPDERPRLVVLEPGRNAVGTPSIKVPIRVQAQDDYGVERVVWLRGHNRSIERPFAMKVELKNGPTTVEAAGAFDLEKLGVRPGDVIDYYFEAADNFPKGPNIALSRMFRLEVISKENYEEVLRSAAARKALFEPYFKLGAWLKRLAERARQLQHTAESDTPAEKAELAREAAALASELAKLRSELGKLAEQAIMFDVEQSFRNELVQQDAALAELSKALQKQASAGPSASELRSIARALSKLSEQEEDNVTVPAQHVAAVARLIAKADVFTRLAKEEEVVARMLRRFAEQRTQLSRAEQLELQEFAHQQRRIHTELQEWLGSLDELLQQVPPDKEYDPLRDDVKKFVQAVKDAAIENDISTSAKVLGEQDAMTGQVLAQNAAEKMAKLIQKCDGLSEQAAICLRFQPKLSTGLGNTLQQILSAIRGQGKGDGQGGQDGYSLFNEDVALYGPGMQMAGDQARAGQAPGGRATAGERVAGVAADPAIDAPRDPARVRLQPNAKFPLRYRELVGEYFKAIADTESEGVQK